MSKGVSSHERATNKYQQKLSGCIVQRNASIVLHLFELERLANFYSDGGLLVETANSSSLIAQACTRTSPLVNSMA